LGADIVSPCLPWRCDPFFPEPGLGGGGRSARLPGSPSLVAAADALSFFLLLGVSPRGGGWTGAQSSQVPASLRHWTDGVEAFPADIVVTQSVMALKMIGTSERRETMMSAAADFKSLKRLFYLDLSCSYLAIMSMYSLTSHRSPRGRCIAFPSPSFLRPVDMAQGARGEHQRGDGCRGAASDESRQGNYV